MTPSRRGTTFQFPATSSGDRLGRGLGSGYNSLAAFRPIQRAHGSTRLERDEPHGQRGAEAPNEGTNLARGLETPQLPAVLLRAEHFPDRHLDAAGGHDLARLPAEQLGVPVGVGRLLQPDPQFLPGPRGGRVHRPLEPAPDNSRDAEPGHVPGRDPGRADPDRHGCRLACPCLERLLGARHRLRHARPASLSDPDGGRTREPDQRHRPELVDVQRGTTGWASDGRFSDRGGGRRSLLPAERA